MAALDRRDVAQVDGAAGDVGHNGIAEFGNGFEFVKRPDQEALISFLQASAGKIDVLRPNPRRDFLDADTELREFLLVDLDLDLVFQATADLDSSSAFFGLQVGLYAVLCKTAQRFQSGFSAVRRICRFLVQEAEPHDRFGRRIEAQQ